MQKGVPSWSCLLAGLRATAGKKTILGPVYAKGPFCLSIHADRHNQPFASICTQVWSPYLHYGPTREASDG